VRTLVVPLLVLAAALPACGPSDRERELAASNRDLIGQLNDLRAAYGGARNDAEQARSDLEKASRERDSARKNLADTQAQAAMIADERDRALQQLSSAQAQVETLTRERDQARAALEEARAAAAQTADLQERVSGLQAQLAEAQRTAETLRSRAKQAQDERDALQVRLDATQQHGSELARQLQATAGDLQEARDSAATLTQNLRTLLESQQGLQTLSVAQQNELADVRRRLEQAQQQVARLTGARGIYTVQWADSLWSIAVFFYHDGSRWPAILRANSHLIDEPDLIFPDMVLIVPEPGPPS